MNHHTLIISFPGSHRQAEHLARRLELPHQRVALHHFPDGESRLALPAELPEQVIFFASLDHPNTKLVELLLGAGAARDQGVSRLTLIAPYLCYMRQDIAFHPGEAVSQRIIGRILAQQFDDVITVDAHLHRIDTLSQAIPSKTAINLSAAELLGEFLIKEKIQPLLIGPDGESHQWVIRIAETSGFDYVIAEKKRFGDQNVSIQLPPACEVKDRCVVIVDDVISSGHTVARTAEQLRQAGAGDIHCLVTHPLFAEGAVDLLKSSGIHHIWSTDSISHSSNIVSLAPLFAQSLQELQL